VNETVTNLYVSLTSFNFKVTPQVISAFLVNTEVLQLVKTDSHSMKVKNSSSQLMEILKFILIISVIYN
jgi:hypothetical protein